MFKILGSCLCTFKDFRLKKFILNISANQAALLVSIIVALFLTPFVVKSLGAAKYGVWVLAVSFTGHYGLLTFGIRGALTRYLAETLGTKDFVKASQYLSTAFLMMLLAAVLTLLAGGILSFYFDKIFIIPKDLVHESSLVCLLIAGAAAATFISGSFHAALVGAQRFDIISAVGISSTIVRAVFTVIVLNAGYGLFGLAMLNLILAVLSGMVEFLILSSLFKPLRIRPATVNRNSVRILWSYGAKSFVISVAVILVFEIDLFVVGTSLGPKFVTIYSLGASLNNYFIQFINAIAYTFGPFATIQYAAHGRKSLIEFFYMASQAMYMLGGIALGGCAFYARPFYKLWMGPGFSMSATILFVLMAAQFFGAGARPCSAVFAATLRIGPQTIAAILEGICNLALSFILVHRFGLLGVAAGTLIPMALNNGIWSPYYACRILNLSILDYYKKSLIPGIIFFFVTGGASKALISLFPVQNWPMLLIQISAVLAFSLLMLAVFGRIFNMAAVEVIAIKLRKARVRS